MSTQIEQLYKERAERRKELNRLNRDLHDVRVRISQIDNKESAEFIRANDKARHLSKGIHAAVDTLEDIEADISIALVKMRNFNV